MTKSVAELKRLQKKLAANLPYYKRRFQRKLHCKNCDYIMPHVIPIDSGGHKGPGIRWECIACGGITIEKKEA